MVEVVSKAERPLICLQATSASPALPTSTSTTGFVFQNCNVNILTGDGSAESRRERSQIFKPHQNRFQQQGMKPGKAKNWKRQQQQRKRWHKKLEDIKTRGEGRQGESNMSGDRRDSMAHDSPLGRSSFAKTRPDHLSRFRRQNWKGSTASAAEGKAPEHGAGAVQEDGPSAQPGSRDSKSEEPRDSERKVATPLLFTDIKCSFPQESFDLLMSLLSPLQKCVVGARIRANKGQYFQARELYNSFLVAIQTTVRTGDKKLVCQLMELQLQWEGDMAIEVEAGSWDDAPTTAGTNGVGGDGDQQFSDHSEADMEVDGVLAEKKHGQV